MSGQVAERDLEQLRYFVAELKTGKFQPEFAGKLNFYVALVDDKLKRPAQSATVGILICGIRTHQEHRQVFHLTSGFFDADC